jgi:hypothetical protein
MPLFFVLIPSMLNSSLSDDCDRYRLDRQYKMAIVRNAIASFGWPVYCILKVCEPCTSGYS